MVAIFAIFCAVGLPVVAIIILIIRLTSSTKKERLEMIRRGMIPPEKVETAPSRLRTLRAGMGGFGLGIGAILSILLVENCFTELNEAYQMLLVMGVMFLCFGIAFVIYYVISEGKIDTEE